MKKIVLLMLGLVMWMSSQAWAQSFEATVNRNKIPEGETFLLTLELDGGRTSNSPDLSNLSADFTTYSVSNAFQTNIINGQVKQSQQWNLVLMPKKAGQVVIPAIRLDNYQTKPITMEVIAAGEEINAPRQQTKDEPAINKFALSASVDNSSPYVQEQIIYTLKLIDRGGLQGEAPYFEGEDANEWIIKSLGEPLINTQIINGETIRELIFKYAMFPQKSGKLIIPAAKFRGYYLTKDRRHDPFGQFFRDDIFIGGFGMTDVFASKNPVFLSSKQIEANVKPATENNGNWWLPAKDVKLQAQFEPGKPEFKVGEPVTRVFYLQATGIIDSQLPEIKFASANGLKQYPEKPEIVMKVQNDDVIAIEKIANVYIPSKSGELVLPAVEIPWFNVRTNRAEVARIPEQKIMVSGTMTASTNSVAPIQPTLNAEIDRKSAENKSSPIMSQGKIYALLGIAFALGILLSLIIMKVLSKREPGEAKVNALKEIRLAAANKDLRKLRDGLLRWAQERYPSEQIFSLNDVEKLIKNQAFSCELEKLGEALYSANDANWNTETFLQVFEKINKTKVRRKNSDDLLPKLYK